jgi:HSP20 family molecular chaperone IbpA
VFLSLLDLLRQSGALTDQVLSPGLDVKDLGDRLELRLHLPGIDSRSVQIGVSESSIAVSGHGTREEKTEGPSFSHSASAVSQFYRELPLPARVDPHRTTAVWEPGDVLVVTLPMGGEV